MTRAAGDLWPVGGAAGDSWPAGWEAGVKYNRIVEIRDPYNPKIDTHNDISVIFFEFCCDGGRRAAGDLWPAGGSADV